MKIHSHWTIEYLLLKKDPFLLLSIQIQITDMTIIKFNTKPCQKQVPELFQPLLLSENFWVNIHLLILNYCLSINLYLVTIIRVNNNVQIYIKLILISRLSVKTPFWWPLLPRHGENLLSGWRSKIMLKRIYKLSWLCSLLWVEWLGLTSLLGCLLGSLSLLV